MSENLMVINGREVSFEPRQTILEVAEANHIKIPTLCYMKGATPTGTCRMCVVEVEGVEKLMASCETLAARGLIVKTESERVVQARKATLGLLLASGNHNCAISSASMDDWTDFQLQVGEADDAIERCPAWGDCELQSLAYQYQVSGDQEMRMEVPYPIELRNPLIVRDFSRCVLCGRCVQACNEVQVNRVIDFGYQGAQAKIVTAYDRALIDSVCVFCGECVQACPTAGLTEKKARYVWRPWKAEKIRTTCPYCGVGCQQWL
ncbi:MAG: 2Fe-2S iron-sulfur cluster-binding protein, partial [Desulfatiglans sp.]|nr:2Fe-2S iron-sulfur cluster-binding protein [Desulfatiglans sp.]